MDNLLEALLNASAPDRDSYRPLIFRPMDPIDRVRLEDLLKTKPQLVVHDALENQLAELVRCTHPDRRFTPSELQDAVKEHLNGRSLGEYGVWVYYPWQGRLVHLLDDAEFALVRTDRNRNKITREEQLILAGKKVGVIGLSVGQSVSLTLALERAFGEIRLADFDTLELNNLNRIRSGVHEMGTLKVVNTAREIAELDPFLNVTIFPEGLTKENMDRFFTEGGELDLLIEECDSVDIKILARQKAKALHIPVVMDMSDRGCMDVERFDLEPERPIMHGWIDHLDLEAAGRPMTNEEKIPYMLPIVGTETLSTRMKASMIEMGETISTWPQLASSVTLGGAMTADVHRRIMLGQFKASGRWYVDLDELITDPGGDEPGGCGTAPSHPEKITVVATGDLTRKAAAIPIPPSVARELAVAGALAPSAGNTQPWNFCLENGRMLLLHDTRRSASRWDPDHLMAHLALGASIENMSIKSADLAIPVNVELLPESGSGNLIASIEAAHGAQPITNERSKQLAPWIVSRCTNRKVVNPSKLPSHIAKALEEVVTMDSCSTLRIIEDRGTIADLADLCSRSEMVRLLDPIGHHEFFKNEVRWTPEEAASTRDGLDLATMEMTQGQLAALRIASDEGAIRLVRSWNGGKALQRFSRTGILNATAIAVIMAPDLAVRSRLTAGRAAQRLWMEANRLGWSVHPISAPIFLTHAKHLITDLDDDLRLELDEVEKSMERIFQGTGTPLFMVRLSPAGQPSTRSLRLPVEDMFTIHKSEN